MDAEIVVCGSGIAGISTAFHLSVDLGREVLVVDPLPPLSLTSDKSTECYRNWWPGRAMVDLMNRSIDLLEEMATASGDVFSLNRRGYLYATADPDRLAELRAEAEKISALGAGPLRVHDTDTDTYRPAQPSGFDADADGADLFTTPGPIGRHFPWITDRAVGALHVRRAGWLSAQGLGAWMLEQAREHGAAVYRAAVATVEVDGDGRVSTVNLDDGTEIRTAAFVNAAGPGLARVGRMVGVELPITCEVHAKLAFRDRRGAVPRHAPMMIWADPQRLEWSTEEQTMLRAQGRTDLLGELPMACHGRPEGGEDSPWVLALWEYRRTVIEPTWPLPADPLYPEVVLKGMATMIPGLAGYLDRLPEPFVDGGYYAKTPENRPLIGPVGPAGSFVCGGLSGYGIMAAAAAGELAALWTTGRSLPRYAPVFDPRRFEDPAYLSQTATSGRAGQL